MTGTTTPPMRVAVIGGSGLAGSAVVRSLGRRGHKAVSISRGSGVDVTTGDGLAAALDGVDTVIDVGNTAAAEPAAMIEFFVTSAANILAAEQEAGVRQHVLLSIIGVDRTRDYPHFTGKLAQETTVAGGGIPYTILRATEFFEFAESAVEWGTKGDFSDVPPLLMQPIAVDDVAEALVDAATAKPTNAIGEIAGPERHDLVDLARRIQAVRGGPVLRLVPSWDQSGFGEEMAGNLLLPGDGAVIAATTFEDWLQGSARSS